MIVRVTARRVVLATAAALSIAAAGGLLLQSGPRTVTDFHPPAEDLCIVATHPTATPHAWDPASGLGRHDARPIPATARCPVCGMYPARFARWAAQLIFEDGAAHFFDSPVDLIMFLDEPSRFDGINATATVAALYVADHDSGTWLDARSAVFVIDSSARGPMRGPDLPAFADESAAARFIAGHGGRMLAFGAIDRHTVASLRDANHAAHMH